MKRQKVIHVGDVIDVRAGPSGERRRGVVIATHPHDEPPAYDVAWADGTSTRLYASERLITLVAPAESGVDAPETFDSR